MIALDTNILLRALVQDDEVQAAAAQYAIEKSCTVEKPGFIASIVLCEMVWVLDRFYKFSRQDICKYVDTVLSAQELVTEYPAQTYSALRDYESGKADFSDYMIRHIAARHGAEKVMTFDRRAGAEDGFILIGNAS